jgi:hypothetical protein
MVRNFGMVLVAILLAAVTGCGGEAKPQAPPTALVKGKVTYQGKSLASGSVLFEPEGAGREAQGTIQPDGTFTLTSYDKDDGAVLGLHRVAVQGKVQGGGPLPIKFNSFNTSKIEFEVGKDKTEYAIELK